MNGLQPMTFFLPLMVDILRKSRKLQNVGQEVQRILGYGMLLVRVQRANVRSDSLNEY